MTMSQRKEECEHYGPDGQMNDHNDEDNMDPEQACHRFSKAFYCTASKKLMVDPVVAPDGNSYERKVAESLYGGTKLYSNLALKSIKDDGVTATTSITGLMKLRSASRRVFFFRKKKTGIPDAFYCPITGNLMREPVIDPEGNTYEKDEIKTWIRSNKRSPITQSRLNEDALYPNEAISVLLLEGRSDSFDYEFMQNSIEYGVDIKNDIGKEKKEVVDDDESCTTDDNSTKKAIEEVLVEEGKKVGSDKKDTKKRLKVLTGLVEVITRLIDAITKLVRAITRLIKATFKLIRSLSDARATCEEKEPEAAGHPEEGSSTEDDNNTEDLDGENERVGEEEELESAGDGSSMQDGNTTEDREAGYNMSEPRDDDVAVPAISEIPLGTGENIDVPEIIGCFPDEFCCCSGCNPGSCCTLPTSQEELEEMFEEHPIGGISVLCLLVLLIVLLFVLLILFLPVVGYSVLAAFVLLCVGACCCCLSNDD